MKKIFSTFVFILLSVISYANVADTTVVALDEIVVSSFYQSSSTVSSVVAPHRDNPEIQKLLKAEFDKFFDRNIRHYAVPDLPIGFVGGLAFHFEKELRDVASEKGYRVAQVLNNPLEGLCKMYLEGILK